MKKGPYLIYEDDNTAMTVLWQLDSSSACSLEWGLNTSYSISNVSVSDYGSDSQYKHTITDLTPGTKYYYRVTENSTYHTGSFYAAPASNATNVKILAFGDTRSYPADMDNVTARMITEYTSDSGYQTFSFLSGDWNDLANEAAWTGEYFNSTYANNRTFQACIPVQGAMGNHEGDGSVFKKYMPYAFASERYYSFDYGPVLVLVIDQYKSYGTGTPQYNWLENELINTSKKWKIIQLHEPGWTAGGHTGEAMVKDYIQPLCIQYGVKLVICGHNHYYTRCEVDGITHITTGGGGAPLSDIDGTGNATNTWYYVAGYKGYHFCKIDIQGDTLEMSAIDTSGNVVDNFSLQYYCTPFVSITNPKYYDQYTDGDDITISTYSYDGDDSISKVEFYNGTTKLGEDTSFPFEFTWTNPPVGQYKKLTAKAMDSTGFTNRSDPVVVDVNASNAAWDLLTSDDFESGLGNFSSGGINAKYYTGSNAPMGNSCVNIEADNGDASSFYYTSGVDVDTPGYTRIKVEFSFKTVDFDNKDEDFWLRYHDGSSWHTTEDYALEIDFENGIVYTNVMAIIWIEEHTFPTDMKIGFMADASGGGDDAYIDDIRVYGFDPNAVLTNVAPVVNDDSYTMDENTTLNITAPGVLNNDTDLNYDSLTAILVTDVANGTLSLSNNGGFVYTPNAGYYGTDSFTYKANDGFFDSAANATVTITIYDVAEGLRMETGKVSVGSNWTTINMSNTYASPVVVCSVQYNNNTIPIVPRVRNAAGNSFEVRLQNPSENSIVADTVHYMVVEEGKWYFPGGRCIEASLVLSDAVNHNDNWLTNKMEHYAYQHSYTTPVALGQVMTYNDADWSVFWACGTNSYAPPDSSSCYVGKHVGEDPDITRANETLGVIIIEAGSGTMSGIPYEIEIGPATIRGIGSLTPPFSYTLTNFSTAPEIGIIAQNTMNAGDGSWPYLYWASPLSSTLIDLAVDEDQLVDPDRKHASERVAYLVFGSAIAMDGSTNSVESTVTLVYPSDSSTIYTSNPLYIWNSISNASKYSIEVRSNNTNGTLLYSDNNVSSTQATLGVLSDGTYVFRVMFSNTAWGDWSDPNQFTVTTTLSVPNNFSVAPLYLAGSTNAVLSWDDISGEAGYQISTNTNTGIHQSLGADVTIWTDSSASHNQTIDYYLRATNGGALSAWTLQQVTMNTPPSVSITFPTNGASFTEPADITITADASDISGTVTKVEFYEGANYLGEDTSSPYSFLWSSVSANNYLLSAKAIDDSLATTTSSTVSITVVPLKVTLVYPTDSSTIYTDNPLYIWNSISNASKYSIEVRSNSTNGTLLYSDNNVSSTQATLGVLSNGTYVFRVMASNTAWSDWSDANQFTVTSGLPVPGNFSVVPLYLAGSTNAVLTWDDISGEAGYQISTNTNTGIHQSLGADVTIWTDSSASHNQIIDYYLRATNGTAVSAWTLQQVTMNTPPSVSITFPTNGASFTEPADITITADASDISGTVTKVEFYEGANYLGEDTSSPYSFLWSSVSANTYSLSAKAIDDSLATTTSSTVSITVAPSSDLRMETGTVSIDSNWTTITMSNTYISPVVICAIHYSNNTIPIVSRVRNASGNSFEVKLQKVSTQPDVVVADTVHYVVVEEGTWQFPDGRNIEASLVLSDDVNNAANWALAKMESYTYQQSYTTPVVLGQIMTENDIRWSVFWSCGTNDTVPPDGSTCNIGRHVGEDPVTARSNETLGIIVIEAGSGEINGKSYETAVGGATIKGMDSSSPSPPYPYTLTNFSVNPEIGIVGQNTMNAGNGSWPYLYGDGTVPLTSTSIQLVVDEDQMDDTERQHGAEQVGYMVFESAIVLEGSSSPGNPKVTLIYPVDSSTIYTSNPLYIWNSISNASKYSIEVRSNNTNGTLLYSDNNVSSTQTTLGVLSDGTYVFRVMFSNTSWGDWSDPSQFTVTTTLSVPNNFSVVPLYLAGSTNAVLTWDDISGEAGYQISTNTNTGIHQSLVADVTIWTDSSASHNQTIDYYLRATNGTAVSAWTLQQVTMNTPPSVSITFPTNGASFTEPADITITADASDISGTVTKVEFYEGANYLGEDTSSPYSFLWSSVSANSYSLSAKAIDDSLATTTSSTVSITVSPDTAVRMETASVNIGSNWTSITLSNSYTSPVVVCAVHYSNNTIPIVPRVRNASGNSFEVRLQKVSTQPDVVVSDTVYYMVVEEGAWQFPDGRNIEASKVLSDAVNDDADWALSKMESYTYQQSYTTPVVLGQVMTENDTKWSVFWSCGANNTVPPNATTCNVGRHVGEDPDITRANETLGVIVIESGSGTIDGKAYETAVGAATIKGLESSPAPPYPYTLTNFSVDPKIGIIAQNTMNIADGSWPYLYGDGTSPLTSTSIKLVVDEDQLDSGPSGTERKHDDEQVAYLVFESAIVLEGSSTTNTNQPPVIVINNINNNDVFGNCITPNIEISNTSYAWTNLNGMPYSGSNICADGSYTLQVIASNDTKVVTNVTVFEIDQSPPDIDVTGISDNDCFPNTVRANFVVTDAHLRTNWATLNGADYSSGELIPEGNHTLKIYAEDDLNNNRTNTYSFCVDETYPVLKIIVNASVPVSSKPVESSFVNDYFFGMSEGSSITNTEGGESKEIETRNLVIMELENGKSYMFEPGAEISIEINDDNLVSVERKINGKDIGTEYIIKEAGEYRILAKGVDKAGNERIIQPIVEIVEEDTEAPEIVIRNISDINYSGCMTVEIEVSDENLDIDSINIELLMNNRPYEPEIEMDKITETRVLYRVRIYESGFYLITVKASDKNGNKAQAGPNKFRVSIPLPVIKISGVENEVCYTNDVKIDVKIDGCAVESSFVSLNDELVYNQIEVSEDNNYELKAGAVDRAGNEANEAVDFRVDKTAPVVEINGVEDGKVYGRVEKIDVKVCDEILDMEKTSVQYDGSDYTAQFKESDTGDNCRELSITGITDTGMHGLEYDVYDCAGWNTKGSVEFGVFPVNFAGNITFIASYDKDLDADYAVLDKKNYGSEKGLSDDGAVNGCAKIVEIGEEGIKSGLMYTNGNVVNPAEGTVSLYVKLDKKDIERNKKRYILTVRDSVEKNDNKALMNILINEDDKGSDKIIFQLGTTSEEEKIMLNCNKWFKSGKWVNIIFNWDFAEGKMKCYINSEKVFDAAIKGSIKCSGKWIMFGTSGKNGENILNGSIDEVKVFDRALSEEEVRELAVSYE